VRAFRAGIKALYAAMASRAAAATRGAAVARHEDAVVYVSHSIAQL
jgi:hypothetical protein